MLGFEALSVLPLSALPVVVVTIDEGGGGGLGHWWLAPDWSKIQTWQREEQEIIILRRKTSSRVGV